MKKSLMALCVVLGTGVCSFADDTSKSSESLVHNRTQVVSVENNGQTNNFSVHSQLYSVDSTSRKDISFTIKDISTTVTIFDNGAQGLSNGDYIDLSHTFTNGESLHAIVTCKDKGKYEVDYSLKFKDGNEIRRVMDNGELDRFSNWLLHFKINPFLKWGSHHYSNLVYAMDGNLPPNLPYMEVKNALFEFEKLLSGLHDGNKETLDDLRKLGSKYMKVIKGK